MSGIFGKLKNLLSSSWDDMIMTLVVIALALLTARMVFGAVIKQTISASPKGAVQAVIESGKHGRQNTLSEVPPKPIYTAVRGVDLMVDH